MDASLTVAELVPVDICGCPRCLRPLPGVQKLVNYAIAARILLDADTVSMSCDDEYETYGVALDALLATGFKFPET